MCFQTTAKVNHLICEINNSTEISWLAGCILLGYGPGRRSFLAAEAWQVDWVQHNLILSVSIRRCRSFQGLSLTRRHPVNARERKVEKKKEEPVTVESSAKLADTLRDDVNGNFCTTCQIQKCADQIHPLDVVQPTQDRTNIASEVESLFLTFPTQI